MNHAGVQGPSEAKSAQSEVLVDDARDDGANCGERHDDGHELEDRCGTHARTLVVRGHVRHCRRPGLLRASRPTYQPALAAQTGPMPASREASSVSVRLQTPHFFNS
jgi:hypothetical protein